MIVVECVCVRNKMSNRTINLVFLSVLLCGGSLALAFFVLLKLMLAIMLLAMLIVM